jgi:hypothetical protein
VNWPSGLQLASFSPLSEAVKTLGTHLLSNTSSFSLLSYDLTSSTFSIHPLVQSWCRAQVAKSPAQQCTSWVLALCVNWEFSSDDYAFRRLLLPHLVALRKGSSPLASTLAVDLARVYKEAGFSQEEEVLKLEALRASVELLGAEHLRH